HTRSRRYWSSDVCSSDLGGLAMKQLVKNDYFSVRHWLLSGATKQTLEDDFLQVSVIEGEATLRLHGKSFTIQKGMHFILPHGIEAFELSGEAEFIVSSV